MIEEGYLDMEGRIKEMENALYTSDQGVIRIVDDVVGALINKGLLKRQYRYGHAKLNGIFCMELGDSEKRPHLHFAIGSNDQSLSKDVLSELHKAYRKMDWVKGDIHIAPYKDSGWLDYLLKTGFDSVVLH